eukprot:snap_masked-scaffold_48-processed-gene-0.21-mRNA-1 protein AED:1.00 eAED:1.00 QI:0/-1/0/0/-1/1/1/0/161
MNFCTEHPLNTNVESSLLLKHYTPKLFNILKSSKLFSIERNGTNDSDETQEETSSCAHCRFITFSGRWTICEEAIVLTLALAMVKCELKEICKAAQLIGIYRKNRAINHKLKRLLGFRTWKKRNINLVREQILSMIAIRELDDKVSPTWKRRIAIVTEKYL